jgi:hypothetical protein
MISVASLLFPKQSENTVAITKELKELPHSTFSLIGFKFGEIYIKDSHLNIQKPEFIVRNKNTTDYTVCNIDLLPDTFQKTAGYGLTKIISDYSTTF